MCCSRVTTGAVWVHLISMSLWAEVVSDGMFDLSGFSGHSTKPLGYCACIPGCASLELAGFDPGICEISV